MLRTLSPIVLTCLLAVACASAHKHRHSHSADESGDDSASSDGDGDGDGERSRRHDDDGESHKSKGESEKTTAEPEFTEGMSVDEATKAVPVDRDRSNIDQETLAKPVQDMSVYEPCKPGSTRVKMRIAVWDGRAVGIDITTAPKNDKLAGCIKQRIGELKWDKKVKSLNTFNFQL